MSEWQRLEEELRQKARRLVGMSSLEILIKEALQAGIERAFDMGYPAPKSGQDFFDHRVVAEREARKWARFVLRKTGKPRCAAIMVFDDQPDGSQLFYLFLGGCDWPMFDKGYLRLWERRTAGPAAPSELDLENLEELLFILAYRFRCPIDFYVGPRSPRSTFRRGEFLSIES
jgi:hypothetical protein